MGLMYCPRCHRIYENPTHRFCPDDGAVLSDEPQAQSLRSRPTQEVGAILDGRYEVRGLIGRGGMARVYLGRAGLTVVVRSLYYDRNCNVTWRKP